MKKMLLLLIISCSIKAMETDLIIIAETDELVIYKTPNGSATYIAEKVTFGSFPPEPSSTLQNATNLLYNPELPQHLVHYYHQRAITHHISCRPKGIK